MSVAAYWRGVEHWMSLPVISSRGLFSQLCSLFGNTFFFFFFCFHTPAKEVSEAMYFIQAVVAGNSCSGCLYQAISGSPCTLSSAPSFYSDTLDQSAQDSDENMTPHFTQAVHGRYYYVFLWSHLSRIWWFWKILWLSGMGQNSGIFFARYVVNQPSFYLKNKK